MKSTHGNPKIGCKSSATGAPDASSNKEKTKGPKSPKSSTRYKINGKG